MQKTAAERSTTSLKYICFYIVIFLNVRFYITGHVVTLKIKIEETKLLRTGFEACHDAVMCSPDLPRLCSLYGRAIATQITK